jgi:CelD/BcsL family acetyltransferase involved in cellulose biosynthesis
VIDDAIRDGKRSVDFLRGRESYKYAWGGRDQETYQLCLRLHASLRRVPPTVAA